MRILCLSNGHGEDIIAVKILQELQRQSDDIQLAALPLVGEGRAYSHLDIPLIGRVQTMPSGGFIYMDRRQMVRDVKGGLLQLTLAQFNAIRKWAKSGNAILAVGDIVPLLFGWLSGVPYAFVGTAKSEYYLRDEVGVLPRKTRAQQWEGWAGSVYLPWERWLMTRRRCQAVFLRDKLTMETLQKWHIPAYNLGNPMMDGIKSENFNPIFDDPNVDLKEKKRSLIITLIPGSRPPEVYHNWQEIILAVNGLISNSQYRAILFLGAIAPGLSLETLQEILTDNGWLMSNKLDSESVIINDSEALQFTQQKATLILTQNAYSDCLNHGDLAIAMAGTATEQFVGLGKPAITIVGKGPQFTAAFAEAQTRLLGPSIILLERPNEVAKVVQSLLGDPDRLQLIAENGRRRMGEAGAAKRIAACLLEKFSYLPTA